MLLRIFDWADKEFSQMEESQGGFSLRVTLVTRWRLGYGVIIESVFRLPPSFIVIPWTTLPAS